MLFSHFNLINKNISLSILQSSKFYVHSIISSNIDDIIIIIIIIIYSFYIPITAPLPLLIIVPPLQMPLATAPPLPQRRGVTFTEHFPNPLLWFMLCMLGPGSGTTRRCVTVGVGFNTLPLAAWKSVFH
ncbi:rCG37897 [Rattus norvegicus]|uniref:RCG37897 n=1 Tax=Rattus norvegicus TaxID=10116 RepID=A6K5X2_RAT|nr:rCG37897 [Rattus norvegicus]